METSDGKARLKTKFNKDLHANVVAAQYGWWQWCEALALPGLRSAVAQETFGFEKRFLEPFLGLV
jgi:hypothetical protein